MKTNKEKASYCIGLETGRNIRAQFKEMDVANLSQGFSDGISGANPQLSQEEIERVMNAIRQQIEAQQKQYVAAVSAENKKEGEAFLAQNKGKPGVKVLPSGLQYQVLSSGTGASPTLLDEVEVHYKGYFIDGREFDSSYARGQPHSFPVNRVIPGWAEVLQLMKVGDKWKVVIPSYLAYGEMGYGPEIGPNTTLIFEMELLKIK